MAKILFVTFNEVGNSMYGGGQCSTRNYNILRKLGHEVELYRIRKRNNISSIKSLLEFNFPPLRNTDIIEVIHLIVKNSYDLVFLDNSSLGEIAKTIRKQNLNVKIYAFFQNIESDYVEVRLPKGIKRSIYKKLVSIAEKNTVLYSDGFFCLTKRDELSIRKKYGKSALDIIPITFSDQYSTDKTYADPYNNHPCAILVGSLKPDTFEGVKWFCESVAPKTNAHYYIIGNGFDSVKESLNSSNVTVLGRVDDLKQYYLYADFVCLPILSGAGMKVKTAEALMFGRYIFGTSEAFEGYEIEAQKVGGLCNNDVDFIESINSFLNKNSELFNNYSRSLFVTHYSDDIALQKFSAIC